MQMSSDTFHVKAYNPIIQAGGGAMKVRRSVLLVAALMVVASSCGDGGPNLPTQAKAWLVQFKRVTLAAETPDRAEIEIVVRTGSGFRKLAADGTKISVETTLGAFEGTGPSIETSTIDGHAVMTLVLPRGPAHMTVTARVDDAEARLAIVVDANGSMRLGS